MTDEIQAATGNGRWVNPSDMSPCCNIANRLYRTANGDVFRFRSSRIAHDVDAWFFPAKLPSEQNK